MLSIFAIFSDIPYYFAAVVEKITGEDMSAVTDLFSDGFAVVIEIIEKLLGA